MSKWRQISIGEFVDFNPSEKINKGDIAKKIPMALLTEFERKISGFEFAEYQAGPKFRNGDTLVAKITPCLENGKTAQVDILDDNEVAFGSSEFIVLRENENSVNDYIFYLAKSPVFRERAISCMEGTSGRKRVNEGALKRQEIVVPDKITQQKIASILSALDDKIALNNKINAELEAMAKTIYDYWFVQFDFPDANGKPFKSSGGKMVYNEVLKREVPEGWEVKKLNNIVKDIKTGLNPRDHFKLNDGGDIYYVTIKNIEYGKVILDNSCDKINKKSYDRIQLRSDLKKGDILFTSIEPVGITYLLHEQPTNWNINESVFNVKPNYDLTTSEFLFMFLSSDELKSKCKNVSTGSIHKGIRITPLKEFDIILPDKKIIDAFTLTIKPILEKLDLNQKQNQQLSQLRDWLLPMLMNGQVTVGQAFEEVLSVAAEDGVEYGKK